MRTLLGLSLALAVGCGGASPRVAGEGALEDASAGRVELRITVPSPVAYYERTQAVTIRDLGGHQYRLEARSSLQHRRFGASDDDGYSVLRHLAYRELEYRQDGQVQSPGSAMSGIDTQQVRTLVDRRGEIVEGPDLAGASSRQQMTAAVLALTRLLAPRFPDEPVAVGDSWSEPVVRWDTPPIHLTVIEIEREWTLLGIETVGDQRFARIGWDVDLTVQPFEISGISAAGQGHLEGFSVVLLEDGTTGHAALDLTLEVGPAGASDVLPVIRVEAKIRDRIAPTADAPPSLVPGVPPSDPTDG